jgi:hypothetical protein
MLAPPVGRCHPFRDDDLETAQFAGAELQAQLAGAPPSHLLPECCCSLSALLCDHAALACVGQAHALQRSRQPTQPQKPRRAERGQLVCWTL